MEYFTDAKVFIYDEQSDEIQYKRSYEHIDASRLLPSNAGKCDGDLLSALTTWTAEKC